MLASNCSCLPCSAIPNEIVGPIYWILALYECSSHDHDTRQGCDDLETSRSVEPPGRREGIDKCRVTIT